MYRDLQRQKKRAQSEDSCDDTDDCYCYLQIEIAEKTNPAELQYVDDSTNPETGEECDSVSPGERVQDKCYS